MEALSNVAIPPTVKSSSICTSSVEWKCSAFIVPEDVISPSTFNEGVPLPLITKDPVISASPFLVPSQSAVTPVKFVPSPI